MPSAIEEKDAIREVLAEYCFALDGGRYDEMAALFTEDGTWDTAFGAANGRAAIAGFDPSEDAIRLSSTLVPSFAAIQSDATPTAGGTLITIDAQHTLTLDTVTPASLTQANFRFT